MAIFDWKWGRNLAPREGKKMLCIDKTSSSIGFHKKSRASDFFQDWWAEVTHGAKTGGSFSEMMGPSIIKLTTVDIWVVYFTYTLTQTLVSIYVY